MKLKLFVLSALLGFCSYAQSVEKQMTVNEVKKNYIALDEIFFDESGIYIQRSGNSIPLSTIHHDEHGYWYEPQDGWQCPNCGRDNPGKYDGQVCGTCGWPVWYQNR